jgi:hypothetical protein
MIPLGTRFRVAFGSDDQGFWCYPACQKTNPRVVGIGDDKDTALKSFIYQVLVQGKGEDAMACDECCCKKECGRCEGVCTGECKTCACEGSCDGSCLSE